MKSLGRFNNNTILILFFNGDKKATFPIDLNR